MNRSYDYDEVGRLWEAHTGNEAEAHIARVQLPPNPTGPYSHSYRYDVWGNMGYRVGWGGTFGVYTEQTHAYANNRRAEHTYDLAGNLTNDGGQYTYDATGQQVNAAQYPPDWNGYTLQQSYDGDALRAKKVDNGTATYYLRSSVLGGQVVAEINSGGGWQRGYVYLGGQLLVIQSEGVPKWVHQDPVTKSQRLTDTQGKVIAAIDLDAWGGETSKSWQSQVQPRKYTTYDRDGSGNDQAMMRQYHGYYMRFDQPDPYAGSMSLADPQSFNRYSYVQNDPVNFVDPSGLFAEGPGRPSDPFDPGRCYTLVIDGVQVGTVGNCGGGGGGNYYLGGGGGGGEPPKPAPTPSSQEQQNFNNCARAAWRQYRKEYLRTSFNAVIGGAGVGLGASAAIGIRVGNIGLGVLGAQHALRDSAVPYIGRVMTASHDLFAGGALGATSGFLSGKLALDAINDARKNSDRLDTALKDCEMRNPGANHSFTFLTL